MTTVANCFTEMLEELKHQCKMKPCGCGGEVHSTVMPHQNDNTDRVRIFCTQCDASTRYHDIDAISLVSTLSPREIIGGIMSEWYRVQGAIYGTEPPAKPSSEAESKPMSDEELVTGIMGIKGE